LGAVLYLDCDYWRSEGCRLMLPGLCIAGGFGSSVASITYAGAVTNTDTSSPVDFASVPIGTASSTRYVAFVLVMGGSSTASAVTVAGQATTLAVNSLTGSTLTVVGITSAPVTSGTTATISLTTGGAITGSNIAQAFAIEGLNSATATDVDSSTASGSGLTITIAAGGVGVGFYTNTGTGNSMTWSAGITEDAETAASFHEVSVGHMTSASAGNVSVNATATAGTSRWGVVTWR
jgi:hypothetical protein